MLRRREMLQVISNLIMNSIYAMPAGGILSVSVKDIEVSPDGIVLTAQDDIVGVAADDLPSLTPSLIRQRFRSKRPILNRCHTSTYAKLCRKNGGN
jgi:signal transduction histidine kinase